MSITSSTLVLFGRDALCRSSGDLAAGHGSTGAHSSTRSPDLTGAAALTEEARTVEEATGINLAPYGALGLAALRGDSAQTAVLVQATLDDATKRGQGIGITFAEWAHATLNNGLGQHQNALRTTTRDPAPSFWPSVEIIEAAVRSGRTSTASSAYRQLTELATASGTDWALGTHARSHALLTEGDAAEDLYREAITRLGRTRIRTDLARAHLLYGEWLRRERRRIDAREQLRTAHRMFEAMGMEAFAERAHRELQATGGTAQKRTALTMRTELTAQETRIARLAREGLSNPEIGARLFISTRTVQYHLRKIFAKLGITSRTQLDRALPSGAATLRPHCPRS
jgi:DNA-binding CsgD family transcriptional regulator